MTPWKLFLIRLFSECKLQYDAWKTAVDWTVALYIVLPAIAVGIYQYRLWWATSPGWAGIIPIDVVFAVCFLFAWGGTIRIFLEDGDQVFLVHHAKWKIHIMSLGIAYSLLFFVLQGVLFFILLAPFLILQYRFSLSRLIGLFLITVLLKGSLGLARQLLSLRYYGWRHFCLEKGFFFLGFLLFVSLAPWVLSSPTTLGAGIAALLAANGVLLFRRLGKKGCFFADIEREQSERMKYIRFLLSLSGQKVREARKKRIRPWLFRNSNSIFVKTDPHNRLVELTIKIFLRNRQQLLLYLQLILICLLIVIGVPKAWSALMWAAFAFILSSYSGVTWKEFTGGEFIHIFGQGSVAVQLVIRKFIFLMTLPGFLLITIAYGFKTFSWVGLLLVPVGVGLVYYLSGTMALYIVSRDTS